jgi:hypothetical protein
VDEYFQYLQSMDEDGSPDQGLVAEVINLFMGNANKILNDVAGLLSAPNPSSLHLLNFLISSWALISSALLGDSQEPARGRLPEGGRPGASTQGVQLQVMMISPFLSPAHL